MNVRYVSIVCMIICLVGAIFSKIEQNNVLIIICSLGFFVLLGLNVKLGNKEIKIKQSERKDEIKKFIANKGLDFNQIIFNLNNSDSLSFNESKEEIYFSNGNEIKEYSFSDILESRIEENGESISKTSRVGQIGGALVGGIIAGGVGAVIGGLSSDRKNINKIKSLDLVLVIDDTNHPIHKLRLFNGTGIYPSDKNYISIKEKAEHWHSLISVFIRRENNKNKATN